MGCWVVVAITPRTLEAHGRSLRHAHAPRQVYTKGAIVELCEFGPLSPTEVVYKQQLIFAGVDMEANCPAWTLDTRLKVSLNFDEQGYLPEVRRACPLCSASKPRAGEAARLSRHADAPIHACAPPPPQPRLTRRVLLVAPARRWR